MPYLQDSQTMALCENRFLEMYINKIWIYYMDNWYTKQVYHQQSPHVSGLWKLNSNFSHNQTLAKYTTRKNSSLNKNFLDEVIAQSYISVESSTNYVVLVDFVYDWVCVVLHRCCKNHKFEILSHLKGFKLKFQNLRVYLL